MSLQFQNERAEENGLQTFSQVKKDWEILKIILGWQRKYTSWKAISENMQVAVIPGQCFKKRLWSWALPLVQKAGLERLLLSNGMCAENFKISLLLKLAVTLQRILSKKLFPSYCFLAGTIFVQEVCLCLKNLLQGICLLPVSELLDIIFEHIGFQFKSIMLNSVAGELSGLVYRFLLLEEEFSNSNNIVTQCAIFHLAWKLGTWLTIIVSEE